MGEVTGLRWCDIDMESGMIDVNHTLVYYDHRTEGSKSGCYFNVNTTKTPASMRQVPMLGFVREAFEQEKQKQEDLGLHCEVTIDGYTDFIFINRFGQAQHQATLNKAILSGIHAYYEPEELVGKTLIAITNLPPRAMMGIDSCGMLLSAVHEEEGEEKLHLLMVDNHIPAGAKLY